MLCLDVTLVSYSGGVMGVGYQVLVFGHFVTVTLVCWELCYQNGLNITKVTRTTLSLQP